MLVRLGFGSSAADHLLGIDMITSHLFRGACGWNMIGPTVPNAHNGAFRSTIAEPKYHRNQGCPTDLVIRVALAQTIDCLCHVRYTALKRRSVTRGHLAQVIAQQINSLLTENFPVDPAAHPVGNNGKQPIASKLKANRILVFLATAFVGVGSANQRAGTSGGCRRHVASLVANYKFGAAGARVEVGAARAGVEVGSDVG